jgi:hypothetical protein
MNSKFKVGDRVECLPEWEGDSAIGLGVVVSAFDPDYPDEVEVRLDGRVEVTAPDPDYVRLLTPTLLTSNEAAVRKGRPIVSGCLDYFSAALQAVAECSLAGNEQHSPGQSLHWDRSKSGDEADALVRHLIDRGTVDKDGIRHSAKVAWRALALLQKELEAEGAPVARAARNIPPSAAREEDNAQTKPRK